MKVGFTGSQHGMTLAQREALKHELLVVANTVGFGKVEFHHGDCIGADVMAATDASYLGYRTIAHPGPDGPKRAHHKSDVILESQKYMDRNDVLANLDVLIATPSTKRELQRSGTWATIRRARRNETPIVMIYPDGTVLRDSDT